MFAMRVLQLFCKFYFHSWDLSSLESATFNLLFGSGKRVRTIKLLAKMFNSFFTGTNIMGVLRNTSLKTFLGAFWATLWVFRDARRSTFAGFVNWLWRVKCCESRVECNFRSKNHEASFTSRKKISHVFFKSTEKEKLFFKKRKHAFCENSKNGKVMSERGTLASFPLLKFWLKWKLHASMFSHLHKYHNETKYFGPKCALFSKNANFWTRSRDNGRTLATSQSEPTGHLGTTV